MSTQIYSRPKCEKVLQNVTRCYWRDPVRKVTSKGFVEKAATEVVFEQKEFPQEEEKAGEKGSCSEQNEEHSEIKWLSPLARAQDGNTDTGLEEQAVAVILREGP